MTYYAYFDSTIANPSPVIGWIDTEAFSAPIQHMPAPVDLVTLTADQWAARFLNKWAVQDGALVTYVPPPPPPPTLQQQARALMRGPVTVVCTSIPSLNGVYPIDQTTQLQIIRVTGAINAGLDLPSGESTFNWFDTSLTPHAWPALQFTAFAKAVMMFLYTAEQVAQGNGSSLPPTTFTLA
jgi:hypothetical protein